MFSMARTQLVASMALALVGINSGVPGSCRELLLLANMLPQDSPRPSNRRASTRAGVASKKRRSARGKKHHREKRKARG